MAGRRGGGTTSGDSRGRVLTDEEVEKLLATPKRLVGNFTLDRMRREPGDTARRVTAYAVDDEGRDYQVTFEQNCHDDRLFSILLEAAVTPGSRAMVPLARINRQLRDHTSAGKQHVHRYSEAAGRLGVYPLRATAPLRFPPRFEEAARFALEYYNVHEAPADPRQGNLLMRQP